jgi:hypothetical protein
LAQQRQGAVSGATPRSLFWANRSRKGFPSIWTGCAADRRR